MGSILGLSTFSLPVSDPIGQPKISPNQALPPSSFPTMFSQPPPVAPSNPGKTARQEQLVKKLVGLLPGTDEDTIKTCIAALRSRHGKLSGMSAEKSLSTKKLSYFRLAY